MPLSSDSPSTKLELSVVLPVHNENPHIEALLLSWIEELKYEGISFEMIVVNDGSLDGTGRILDKIRKEHSEVRLVHQLNLGKDRAYRRGYEIARGQYILSISGNGRVEPSDFLLLWKRRAEGYLVLAHRSHRLDSYLSQKLSSFLSFLMKSFYHLDVQEPDSAFRLFVREVLEPTLELMPPQVHCFQWSFTAITETLFPGKVIEVMVPYRHRLERCSPFRRKSILGSAWTHFITAIQLKWKSERYHRKSSNQSEEICLT